MIIEYLFLNSNDQESVKEYIDSFSNTHSKFAFIYLNSEYNYWILISELKGNSEDKAKQLSKFNDIIVNNYSPIILVNEAAAYFNQKLYPLINTFERYLRTFVYIKAAMCNDPVLSSMISGLEEKDFGEITNILFVDSSFVKKAKDAVKNLSSRSEMITALEEIEESTNWSKMVDNDKLQSIKENFYLLKDYRNDIMHAHNITYQKYREIKTLFEKCNMELNTEINSIITIPTSTGVDRELASELINTIASNENENYKRHGYDTVISIDKIVDAILGALEKTKVKDEKSNRFDYKSIDRERRKNKAGRRKKV